MIKQYLLFSSFTILLLFFVIFDYLTKTDKREKSQIKFTKVTNIVELSFSASLLEDRFLHLTKTINTIYPTLPKIDKKGFVYVK